MSAASWMAAWMSDADELASSSSNLSVIASASSSPATRAVFPGLLSVTWTGCVHRYRRDTPLSASWTHGLPRGGNQRSLDDKLDDIRPNGARRLAQDECLNDSSRDDT